MWLIKAKIRIKGNPNEINYHQALVDGMRRVSALNALNQRRPSIEINGRQMG